MASNKNHDVPMDMSYHQQARVDALRIRAGPKSDRPPPDNASVPMSDGTEGLKFPEISPPRFQQPNFARFRKPIVAGSPKHLLGHITRQPISWASNQGVRDPEKQSFGIKKNQGRAAAQLGFPEEFLG